jgi:hypothetical protein
MTQVGSRASQFAVMQNALPIFDVVGYDPRLEGSHEVTIAAVNTALFKRLRAGRPFPVHVHIFRATAYGSEAYSIPNDLTVFGRALIDCLSGLAGVDDAGEYDPATRRDC